VNVRVFADPVELGAALAGEILAAYEATAGRFLLGCPGGRTPLSTYRALAARGADLSRLVVVMMDEYLDDDLRPVPADAHHSCRGFALRELAAPLGLAEAQVWLPDPAAPAAYDERIEAAGGIDLFVLASGASDGHVAFLPPGSSLAGRTSVVELAESTRRDNLATFPAFASIDEVPTRGVSIGLGTVTAARRVRLVLHGAGKREAARSVLALDGFDPAWPASVVHACADAEVWLDREAAAGRRSTRSRAPRGPS
jgi:glucosamine-6-phosphate deaminase